MTYSARISPPARSELERCGENFIAVFEEMMELLRSAVPAVSAA